MLIDEIKKAKIEAMKAHDEDRKNAYSMILSRYQILLTSGNEVKDSDEPVISIIMKFAKELDEEAEGYKKAGREDSYNATIRQKEAIVSFLPKMLSEDEIKTIILSLEDRSIPSVMKHFKMNYAGKADMGMVNKVARSIQ